MGSLKRSFFKSDVRCKGRIPDTMSPLLTLQKSFYERYRPYNFIGILLFNASNDGSHDAEY